jgi:DNA adenine methylase
LLQNHSITLSDLNLRLIRTWRAVRDNPEGLIDRLEEHRKRHSVAHFYATRALDVDSYKQDADVGGWMIYLNKTAFNGLYRVNKKNRFNAPFGRYKKPNICDAENLRACSIALQNVELIHEQFAHLRKKVHHQDFVYFDPPYVPASVTSSFTSYTKEGFGSLEQVMLRNLAQELKEKGAHVMISNAEHPVVREWYGDFQIRSIQASRSINSKASKRGPVGEVIIT